MTPLDRFIHAARKYLIIHNSEYIDVLFGTIFANRLDSKPVWLYLVGPPSSGKTEIVQAIVGDEIFQLSLLKENALISGFQDPSIPKRKREEPSLLPKWNNKTVIIKDFTALLNIRRDSLMAILGILRDAYDGKVVKVFGTGEIKEFSSKFGIIAAVTNVIDKNRGVLAELGERFLTYRCLDVNDKEATERCWKVSGPREVKKQEAELQKRAREVLSQKIHKVILSDHFRKSLIETAKFVAVARCEVSRNQYTKEPEIPTPEIATRLTRQLCDLAIGIAVVRGEGRITKSVQQLIFKIAMDSLIVKRIKLLNILYHAFPKALTTQEIAIQIRFSESIVRRWLEELLLLNLLSRRLVKHLGIHQALWKVRNHKILHSVWKRARL